MALLIKSQIQGTTPNEMDPFHFSDLRMIKVKHVVVLIFLLMVLPFCGKNPVDDSGDPMLPTPVYPSPYEDPFWSADGKTIVFRRMKVTRIDGLGGCSIDPDSTGLWMINADCTNMRLLLQGLNLYTPVLSPDGEWLAYETGGQIYKARLVDGQIDTTHLVQLTTDGSNFFPAWSPDGQWIAYDNTNCGSQVEPAPPNSCGILVIKSDGQEIKFIIRGRMPDWSPDGKNLIYIGLKNEIYRVNIDAIDPVRLTSLNQDDPYEVDNRSPKYSPDGKTIAFNSQSQNGGGPQIWIMNVDGTCPEKLTTEGWSVYPSWSPDERIVYMHHISRQLNVNNGTLWIMDADGGNKYQLTFNYGLIL